MKQQIAKLMRDQGISERRARKIVARMPAKPAKKAPAKKGKG